MITKRRVLIVLLFLLAGAVVNVAVAWGCAYWTVGIELYNDYHSLTDPLYPNQSELDWLKDFEAPGFDDHRWTYGELREFGITRRAYYRIHKSQLGPSDFKWALLYRPQVAVISAGWPLRSLQTIETPNTRPPFKLFEHHYRPAIVVHREVNLSGPRVLPRPLPLWPKAAGFLVNSILFGALLWAIPFGPRAVRRYRRRRRNCCPSCNYDLRGADHAVCPECGK